MRTARGPVTIVLVAAAVVSLTADTGFLDRTITLTGEAYRYQVYVPQEWRETERWPVILYLHDNNRQGSDGLSR